MIKTASSTRKRPVSASRRKTQAERSSTTQNRICQATLEALAEVGHERISTTMIAQMAEVSRGALTHQFPTRNDMLVAALHHLHEKWQETEPFTSDPDTVQHSLPEMADMLWRNIFSDKHYIASVELMLAARLDNELGRRLREEMKRWVDLRDVRMARLVGFDPASSANTLQLQLILSVLRGIAVHQSFDQDETTSAQLIELWKSILSRISMGDVLPQRIDQGRTGIIS